MKSVKTDKPSGVEYPCLMESKSGTIVLMWFHGEGVAVAGSHATGSYDSDWNMDEFTLYTGSVTLSN